MFAVQPRPRANRLHICKQGLIAPIPRMVSPPAFRVNGYVRPTLRSQNCPTQRCHFLRSISHVHLSLTSHQIGFAVRASTTTDDFSKSERIWATIERLGVCRQNIAKLSEAVQELNAARDELALAYSSIRRDLAATVLQTAVSLREIPIRADSFDRDLSA